MGKRLTNEQRLINALGAAALATARETLTPKPPVSFDISKDDSAAIDRIIERIDRERPVQSDKLTGEERLDISMSLAACHANGCPLDFARLLEARRFDFYHDVNGILRHIDRSTGQLQNCFLPRFAQRQGR